MMNTPTLAMIGIPEKSGQWPERVHQTHKVIKAT